MRQRRKPWADGLLDSNQQLVIQTPTFYKGKWASMFDNERPIYIEIGTGKGQFLSGMASQYPNVNFIGIELDKDIIATAAKKVLASACNNILLLHMNAADLCDVFTEREVSGIYLNFSDPWPKNRHEKRRLTFHTFLEKYREILQPSGEIVMKTDNREFFEYSLVSFSAFGLELSMVNLDLHQMEDPTNVMTEYEEKFAAKGQVIYRCIAKFT